MRFKPRKLSVALCTSFLCCFYLQRSAGASRLTTSTFDDPIRIVHKQLYSVPYSLHSTGYAVVCGDAEIAANLRPDQVHILLDVCFAAKLEITTSSST